ncbi:hypothetical protein ATANTOWER_030147 [Ataeniobius toweri]|uniref:Uncharacterized protein n=1 Tax=Ataeniobius toweri TaxID=208326 RepID=A0ABU7CDJ7_9TELE|nr:hypothetical protein [Ataeniobius toweri]
MPNGSCLKKKCPKGVMNVVSFAESSFRGICQNPIFASSLQKFLAPASMPSVSSADGRIDFSQHTDSFSLLRSTHKRTYHPQTSLFAPHPCISPRGFPCGIVPA